MSTRVNINVSGFDILNFKQKAENTRDQNREQLVNETRLEQLDLKAREAKALELKRKGISENGQVLSGKFMPALEQEEFAPRPTKGSVFGHLWTKTTNVDINASGMASFGRLNWGSITLVEPTSRTVASLRQRYITTTEKINIAVGSGIEKSGFVHDVDTPNLFSGNSQSYPLQAGWWDIFTGEACTPTSGGALCRYFRKATGNVDLSFLWEFSVAPFSLMILPAGGDKFIAITQYAAWWYNFSGTVPAYNTPISYLGNSDFTSIGLEYDIVTRPNGTNYAILTTPFSVDTQVRFSQKCFICSNSKIREISIPQNLSAIIGEPQISKRQIFEEFTLVDAGEKGLPGGIMPCYIQGEVDDVELPNFSSSSHGAVGFGGVTLNNETGTTRGATPGVFKSMAETSPAIAELFEGINVLDFPTNEKWIVPDTSSGFYNALDSENSLMRHGRWRIANQEPFPVYQSGNPLQYSYPAGSYSPIRSADLFLNRNSFTFFDEPNNEVDHYIVWDWDRPDYCRTMCLALGFPISDLTP